MNLVEVLVAAKKMFKPVVDDYATQPFLPKEPLILIEKGEFKRVPVIIGSNKDEGLIFLNFNKNLREDVMHNFDKYIPNTFLYRETDSHDEGTAKFAQMVKEEIFQGRIPDLYTEDKYKFIELHGWRRLCKLCFHQVCQDYVRKEHTACLRVQVSPCGLIHHE